MLFINNPQAAEAILEGRRYDHGQRTTSVSDLPVPNEATEPSQQSKPLVPLLPAALPTN